MESQACVRSYISSITSYGSPGELTPDDNLPQNPSARSWSFSTNSRRGGFLPSCSNASLFQQIWISRFDYREVPFIVSNFQNIQSLLLHEVFVDHKLLEKWVQNLGI